MIIEVHPWKLDVDIEGTKNFYKDNDYSLPIIAEACTDAAFG